jgi:hypothetical protein
MAEDCSLLERFSELLASASPDRFLSVREDELLSRDEDLTRDQELNIVSILR